MFISQDRETKFFFSYLSLETVKGRKTSEDLTKERRPFPTPILPKALSSWIVVCLVGGYGGNRIVPVREPGE
jgi:hypothetical protein